jgi:putative acetyltransferase
MPGTEPLRDGNEHSPAHLTVRVPVRIRLYQPKDLQFVRKLFVTINRQLAPPHMRTQFDVYVRQALKDEIDRIPEYYAARAGSFWIAELGDGSCGVGMSGLESYDDRSLEIRRMYVDPSFRRQGIARRLLAHAEQIGRAAQYHRLVLSTSEIQKAAFALYQSVGFSLTSTETANAMSLKAVGGGLRRYHMQKLLR